MEACIVDCVFNGITIRLIALIKCPTVRKAKKNVENQFPFSRKFYPLKHGKPLLPKYALYYINLASLVVKQDMEELIPVTQKCPCTLDLLNSISSLK